MNQQKYICSFNRDRDSYQIPLCLAEIEKLDVFITDYYSHPSLHLKSLEHRQIDGLDYRLTKNTLKAVALQGLWKKSKFVLPNVKFPELRVDKYIANNVRRYSKNSSSNLFLYNNYARTLAILGIEIN